MEIKNIFSFTYPYLAFLSFFFYLWLQDFNILVKYILSNQFHLIKLVKIAHKYPGCLTESNLKKTTLKYIVASGNK